MRTTINIADDVLCVVKERARIEGRSAGEVLSELARVALTKPTGSAGFSEGEAFYGFEPLPSRGSVVSNELIDLLRDESALQSQP